MDNVPYKRYTTVRTDNVPFNQYTSVLQIKGARSLPLGYENPVVYTPQNAVQSSLPYNKMSPINRDPQ